jgi:hypothetical protein
LLQIGTEYDLQQALNKICKEHNPKISGTKRKVMAFKVRQRTNTEIVIEEKVTV